MRFTRTQGPFNVHYAANDSWLVKRGAMELCAVYNKSANDNDRIVIKTEYTIKSFPSGSLRLHGTQHHHLFDFRQTRHFFFSLKPSAASCGRTTLHLMTSLFNLPQKASLHFTLICQRLFLITHMILNGWYFTASCWTRDTGFILIHSSFVIIWIVLRYQIAVNRCWSGRASGDMRVKTWRNVDRMKREKKGKRKFSETEKMFQTLLEWENNIKANLIYPQLFVW